MGSTTDAVRGVGGVWYQANAAYWTPSTDFVNAYQGTIDAALSLGIGSDFVQGLRDSWADAGINCAGPESFVCDRNDECDAGAGETCASCPDDCGACWRRSAATATRRASTTATAAPTSPTSAAERGG